MPYRPHETLIKPARPSAQPIRLAIGLVVATATYVLLLSFVIPFAAGFLVQDGDLNAARDTLIRATTPATVLFTLYSFTLMIAALWVTLKLVHRRSLWGLIGPQFVFIRQFLRVSAYLLALEAFLFLIPISDAMPISEGLEINIWLKFLPFALTGLLIQVSAEELIFRGYIQSQLAARFAHPVIWIGLPSLFFGWLHYSPELAGDNAIIAATLLTLFAVAAADLTARSGTLAPAIALHFFNNFSAILIIAPEGDISGLALFTYPLSEIQDPGNLINYAISFLFLLCSWLAARIAIRR